MRLGAFYIRALFRRLPYILILITAIASALLIHPKSFSLPAEGQSTLGIGFILTAYLLTFLANPRNLLGISPFFLSLPAIRERLALLLWVAVTIPLLLFLWPLYGFSLSWMLHAISLLEIALLTSGSVLAWSFLPIPLLALIMACNANRWFWFLLFGMPYLVSGGWKIGSRLKSLHFSGFRYTPRYALPVAIFLLFFDLYQRTSHTTMRFLFSASVFGLEMPDPERLSLFLFFLMGGILFMLLPFLNVFGLRQAEEPLIPLRRMLGTPWRRRLTGLGVALLVNFWPFLIMHNLAFVRIDTRLLWHFVFSAACFNILFQTTEKSDWTAYSLVIYLLWLHLTPPLQGRFWWLWDVGLAAITLLAYDLDIWLPSMLRQIWQPLRGVFWNEA